MSPASGATGNACRSATIPFAASPVSVAVASSRVASWPIRTGQRAKRINARTIRGRAGALRAGGIWAMRLVRWLAWSVGFLFLVGTVLQLVDFFNLYTDAAGRPRVAEHGRVSAGRPGLPGCGLADLPVEQPRHRHRLHGGDRARAGVGGPRCERQFAPGGHRCWPRHGGDLRRRGPAADHRRDAAHDR